MASFPHVKFQISNLSNFSSLGYGFCVTIKNGFSNPKLIKNICHTFFSFSAFMVLTFLVMVMMMMKMKAAALRTPVWAKHCSKPFPQINSFTPHNRPREAGTIFIPILQK